MMEDPKTALFNQIQSSQECDVSCGPLQSRELTKYRPISSCLCLYSVCEVNNIGDNYDVNCFPVVNIGQINNVFTF